MQTRVSNYPRFKGCALGQRIMKVVLAAGAVAALGGCTHWDSYLNPSVVGYWENTPSSVPILERIAMIEDEADQPVSFSPIAPGDLMPEPDDYKLAPGDSLAITVYDLVTQGAPMTELRVIDQTGYIEYPQLGRFYVIGLTEDEFRRVLEDRTREFVDDPLVSVSVQQRRMQAFHLYGNVRTPGPYMIPASDYRLLEALIAAGGIGETVRYVHVIRQVPLTKATRPDSPTRTTPSTTPPPRGEDLLDMIDDLSGGRGTLPTRSAETLPGLTQPAQDGGGRAPVVDLLDPATDRRAPLVEIDSGSPVGVSSSRWVFLNGEWVMTTGVARVATSRGAGGVTSDQYLEVAGTLMTQRVIRVPLKPLLSGDARYNIVVRPGDIIRVPLPESGVVYIDGQVNRPGVFNLPGVGRLTLTRAITAAGGLGGLAIPERVDLTRVVGENQQSTIMLNLRAISQGTQPDVYLKADDRINVGTNFWAFPLAVLRNGFRTSYGFGFLLDRNFGNDVFGAPPTNRAGF